MVKTLPTIEDITRATIPTTTRRINDEGLIQFEYSDDGFCIFRLDKAACTRK